MSIHTSARAYTLDEIDRLRREIERQETDGLDYWDTQDMEETIERKLRTALIANVEPPIARQR